VGLVGHFHVSIEPLVAFFTLKQKEEGEKETVKATQTKSVFISLLH